MICAMYMAFYATNNFVTATADTGRLTIKGKEEKCVGEKVMV